MTEVLADVRSDPGIREVVAIEDGKKFVGLEVDRTRLNECMSQAENMREAFNTPEVKALLGDVTIDMVAPPQMVSELLFEGAQVLGDLPANKEGSSLALGGVVEDLLKSKKKDEDYNGFFKAVQAA